MIINPTQVTKQMLRTKGTEVILKDGADAAMFAECRRETYVVKDLFERKLYTRDGWVGIGPADRKLAIGVRLEDIVTIIIP